MVLVVMCQEERSTTGTSCRADCEAIGGSGPGGGRGAQVSGQGWNKVNKLRASPTTITGRVVAGIVSGRIDDYHQFELVADPQ